MKTFFPNKLVTHAWLLLLIKIWCYPCTVLCHRSGNWSQSLRLTWICWLLRGSWTRPLCVRGWIFRRPSRGQSRYVSLLEFHFKHSFPCQNGIVNGTVNKQVHWTNHSWENDAHFVCFIFSSKRENCESSYQTPLTQQNQMLKMEKAPLHHGNCVLKDVCWKMLVSCWYLAT